MNFYRAYRSFLFIIPNIYFNFNIKSAFYMDKTQLSGKKIAKRIHAVRIVRSSCKDNTPDFRLKSVRNYSEISHIFLCFIHIICKMCIVFCPHIR